MKNMISSRQMMFSVGTFIMASSLLIKSLYSYLKQEAWIGVVLGFLISLPVIWIYQALAKRFPSKSLIEINDAVFGRIVGKVVSVLYTFFFLSLTCLNTRELGDFVKSVILYKTPKVIIIIMFIFVCAFAIQKGIRNLTRCSAIFVIVTIASVLFYFLLLINEIKLQNLLPMVTMPIENYLIGTHLVTALPLCEIFVFFMLLPYMQKP
ncbi:MAG: spore gernimation protein, partial [Candidatus Moranbacteria bacterium]|nr:spore gernimation protein [Candidatus Moranbacteria bacterium]